MWQATFEKLSSGRANDWPFQGIASSPLVIDGNAYFMSNRAVVLAVDIQGFHDNENDGPFKDEKLTGKGDVDILWMFDTMEEVGNFPAQPRELVAGRARQHDLRLDRQRAGRKPRQHPVAAGARDHRARL